MWRSSFFFLRLIIINELLVERVHISSAINERKERERGRERRKKKKRMKHFYVTLVPVVATILFSIYVSVRSDGGK